MLKFDVVEIVTATYKAAESVDGPLYPIGKDDIRLLVNGESTNISLQESKFIL